MKMFEGQGEGCLASISTFIRGLRIEVQKAEKKRLGRRLKQIDEFDWPVGPDGNKYDPRIGHPWSHGP